MVRLTRIPNPQRLASISSAEEGMTIRHLQKGHAGGRAQMAFRQKRNFLVKVQISTNLCQGHGRCYDLAPAIFYEDEEGYGQVLGDGVVSPERQDDARRAALNCPEHAITLTGGA